MKSIKRFFLVAAAILIASTSASAQFKFGIKAGMNVNKIHFNKDIVKDFGQENSTGWTIGAMAEFTVPVIGICLDASLMYARMNNNANDEIISAVTYYDSAYTGAMSALESGNVFCRNFLEIPINLKYKLTIPIVAKYIKPYVFTGPNFAFRLDKNTLKDFKTKSCEVAWNVGLGVELFSHVQIGGSYAFGINNILDKANQLGLGITSINSEKLKARNSYWTISAAYLF